MLWLIERAHAIQGDKLDSNLLDVIAEGDDFMVVSGGYDHVQAAIRGSAWKIVGHPGDGVWYDSAGRHVFILDGVVVQDKYAFWDSFGFVPEDFGATNWTDVDEDVVFSYIPHYA